MTITVVQSVAIASSYSGNFGSAVTTGNSIVMAVTGRNVGSTITTSNPQYNGASVTGATKLVDQNNSGGAVGDTYVSIWLLPDVASSGTSLSITTNSTPASFVGIIAYEVSGLGSNPTLDKSNSNTNTGATDQNSGASGNITQAPEFVVGTICQDGTVGSSYPPAGWTSQTVGTNNSVAGYQIPTSSGSSFTYDIGTGNADWTGAIATIYAGSSSAVSGTVQPRATVPAPRRRPAGLVIARLYGRALVAVPATGQNRTAPRRLPARAYWHGAAGPQPPPQSGPPGTVPAMTVNRTELMSRVTGRVIRR